MCYEEVAGLALCLVGDVVSQACSGCVKLWGLRGLSSRWRGGSLLDSVRLEHSRVPSTASTRTIVVAALCPQFHLQIAVRLVTPEVVLVVTSADGARCKLVLARARVRCALSARRAGSVLNSLASRETSLGLDLCGLGADRRGAWREIYRWCLSLSQGPPVVDVGRSRDYFCICFCFLLWCNL